MIPGHEGQGQGKNNAKLERRGQANGRARLGGKATRLPNGPAMRQARRGRGLRGIGHGRGDRWGATWHTGTGAAQGSGKAHKTIRRTAGTTTSAIRQSRAASIVLVASSYCSRSLHSSLAFALPRNHARVPTHTWCLQLHASASLSSPLPRCYEHGRPALSLVALPPAAS